ncbi:beta' subunit, partial [Kappamyces sp. JEL0680]
MFRIQRSLQSAALKSSKRFLSIHEHSSMGLLKSYGITVARGEVATTASQAEEIAKKLGSQDVVVKAQVLAGGRGKGHFTSGPAQAKEYASKMLGSKLITKQTGAAGRDCEKPSAANRQVFVVERVYVRREFYFALVMDRKTQGPVIIASSQGGMDIETVAHNTPEAIVTLPIDINSGLSFADAVSVAKQIGFEGDTIEKAADTFLKLYKIFIEKDATMVEINPLAEVQSGEVMCMDAKFGFDDNAEFRQPDIFALRDKSQEDPREVAAAKWNLNYIGLDGTIGCL